MYYVAHANSHVVLYWLYFLNNCNKTRLSVSFQIDFDIIEYYTKLDWAENKSGAKILQNVYPF